MATPGKALKRCRNVVRLMIQNARQGQPMQEYANNPATPLSMTPRSLPASSPSTRSSAFIASSSSSSSMEELRKAKPTLSPPVLMPRDVSMHSEADLFWDDGTPVPSEGVSLLVHRSGLPSLLRMANAMMAEDVRTSREEPAPECSASSSDASLECVEAVAALDSAKEAPKSLLLPIATRFSKYVTDEGITSVVNAHSSGFASHTAQAAAPMQSDTEETTGFLVTKSNPSSKHVQLREEAEWIMFDEDDSCIPPVLESRPIRADGSSGKLLPRCMMQANVAVPVSVFVHDEAPLDLKGQAQLSRCKSFECFEPGSDISSIPGLQQRRTMPSFASCACTSVSTADELKYCAQIE